jgi:signal transduction histidine kinase
MTRRRKTILAALLLVLVAGLIGARQIYLNRPDRGLPYRADFSPTAEDHWTALGGTWEVGDGSIRNDSNDRGAKILTGSKNWDDYVLEGDAQLLGRGSVGIMGRVGTAALGENSFQGYVVGVRTADHSLFLGAYDFVYREAARVEMPQPVRPYSWYHLKLEFNGCRITASAWELGTQDIQSRTIDDPNCFRSGRIGLRTNGTGGVWRNVSVYATGSAPVVAKRVDDLSERDAAFFKGALLLPQEASLPMAPQSIRSLQYLPVFGSRVAAIRGFVTLTRPAVYVQDSTGGIEVQFDGPTALKIGDEVEIMGEVNHDEFSPAMEPSHFRRLRESTPDGPQSVAADQLASGDFDGQFVQVEGTLRAITSKADGSVTMAFDTGYQSFQAIVPPGRSPSHVKDIALGSVLRLKGVSATASQFKDPADPFVILLRSAEGIDVIAGPPWWHPTSLIFVCLLALGLVFAANQLVLMMKNWRLHAVAEERERLAHQIHDTLAQSFAGIGFQLQAIRNTIPPENADFEQRVDLAMSMARSSHEEARRCIANLRPESLDNLVLLPALTEYANWMVKNGAVNVEACGTGDGQVQPARVKDALFRIGKEAITNAVLHAEPRTIRISLERERSFYLLAVEDDGVGFRQSGEAAGFGLPGMRRRANRISATLTIKSKPGLGTRVEVRAPAPAKFLALERIKKVARRKSLVEEEV